MSDYIYTSKSEHAEKLSASIKKIYQAYDIECQEFSGPWGSLSVSPSPYRGLQPLETERHICVILGGPALYFRDNKFLTGSNPTEGTRALLERFLNGELDLVNDVSGPFQILVIDKATGIVTCITDLMLFIPAYVNEDENKEVTFGSHVDAVARVTAQTDKLDKTSVADFILHGVVTYPYTVFSHISQMHPATEYKFSIHNNELTGKEVEPPYWLPHETNNFTSLGEAAKTLREGAANHVNTITESMSHVAQFISGGEDSRTLLGLMPEHLQRDGYVFLDSMNREGKIAKKVADAYGANFQMGERDPLHYLHIVDEATALVGSGHQYLHCHALRFDREFSLNKYPAVFGGYSSDVFLKGHFARKSDVSRKLSFLPERCLKGEGHSEPVKSALFHSSILEEVSSRRVAHVELVRKFRPETLHEWFNVWPSTMRQAIPNHYCNRRLFASYEVFMSHEVVKVSAGVPTEWKLNRKLFHKAFQPCLAKSKWIRHGDGRLPYFGQATNAPALLINFIERAFKKLKLIRKNEGAWFAWDNLYNSPEWQSIVHQVNDELKGLNVVKETKFIPPNTLKSQNLLSLRNIYSQKVLKEV